MPTITKYNSNSTRSSTHWARVIDSDSDSDSDYEAKDKDKVHSLPIPSTSADERTFADELRQFSKDTLEKEKKKKEERARIREESVGRTISYLMSKYHPIIKKKLFDVAKCGKRQFRFWIYHKEDLAFDFWVPKNCINPEKNHGNYIEPSEFTKELLNPNSKFLPFKKDGITRDSFTGLTVTHGEAFDQYYGKKFRVIDFSW